MADVKQRGIRTTSAVVASPVTGAAAALYAIPAGRSFIIRKISWFNACAGAADSDLSIGQGLAAAFVAALPAIHTLGGFSGTLAEDELPAVEFQYVPVIGVAAALTDITFESTVAGIDVVIEVEEVE